MIEQDDAKKVVEVIGNNLIGVSHDSSSFAKFNEISNSKLANPTGNNMYVELKKKSVKKSKMVFKTN